jgi:hypothetical protein
MKKNKLDELEKRIHLDAVQRKREKSEKAGEDARWAACLRKKSENCQRILKTRHELAKEVHRVFPAYQKLLASPEWARLNRCLDYMNRKWPDAKESRKFIELPNMNVNWAVPAAFLSGECSGSNDDDATWDGVFTWQIGSRISLCHTIINGAHGYGFHHEYDLARFPRFEDLAAVPKLLKPTDPRVSSDAPDESSGEAEAIVILCTRRLLEWVSKGQIVDMVAKEYEKFFDDV